MTLTPRLTEMAGEYAADFTPVLPGSYELHAEAGESERDSFWVEVASTPTTSDTRPDFERLKVLAQKSGGRFVEAGQLDAKELRRWISAQRAAGRSGGKGMEVFFVALAFCARWGENGCFDGYGGCRER